MVSGHASPGTNVEVRNMALESVHACDCPNGFTYVGTISVGKVSGGVGATHLLGARVAAGAVVEQRPSRRDGPTCDG